MVQEKSPDTCKEQLNGVCHVGPSNEPIPLVSFAEKLSGELQYVPETEDACIEKLNASFVDLMKELAFPLSSGEDQSKDMENSSIKVLEGDGSSNMAPPIVHFIGDIESEEDAMELDTTHTKPQQDSELCNSTDLTQEQSTVPTCPPCPEIRPTDASAFTTHHQRNVIHDTSCQDQASFRAVLGPVPTCPACPAIRSIHVPASTSCCPSNVIHAYSEDQASFGPVLGNQAEFFIHSLVETGVNLLQQSSALVPLVRIEPYIADVSIGNIFPGSTGNYFGQPYSVRPDLAQCTGPDPLQVVLERIEKEKEDAIKKHHDMIMQLNTARDKEMEQIHKKYNRLLQDAETA